ncbi:hypothetical protein A2U01_0085447, partial [Trifolium medium]|nr:hypothetical protein [Trifolium medium]
PMVRQRVRSVPYIESLPDKCGQTAGPVEYSNGGTSVRGKKASA